MVFLMYKLVMYKKAKFVGAAEHELKAWLPIDDKLAISKRATTFPFHEPNQATATASPRAIPFDSAEISSNRHVGDTLKDEVRRPDPCRYCLVACAYQSTRRAETQFAHSSSSPRLASASLLGQETGRTQAPAAAARVLRLKETINSATQGNNFDFGIE
ncbi:hypothetical protein Droror1_Dr00006263 [Drosera rotundifolia]